MSPASMDTCCFAVSQCQVTDPSLQEPGPFLQPCVSASLPPKSGRMSPPPSSLHQLQRLLPPQVGGPLILFSTILNLCRRALLHGTSMSLRTHMLPNIPTTPGVTILHPDSKQTPALSSSRSIYNTSAYQPSTFGWVSTNSSQILHRPQGAGKKNPNKKPQEKKFISSSQSLVANILRTNTWNL